ncbi:hypothetical protein ACFRQM_13405 [Streptomyces sp. NPDC056831]|uniref:hypothetical protein n=1 Tax=Streptomyces sp. NPDC056831 TaxID=3345954 RepID=UPI00367E752F
MPDRKKASEHHPFRRLITAACAVLVVGAGLTAPMATAAPPDGAPDAASTALRTPAPTRPGPPTGRPR